jgi:hypothetical protein
MESGERGFMDSGIDDKNLHAGRSEFGVQVINPGQSSNEADQALFPGDGKN